jgi:hypothetical protein
MTDEKNKNEQTWVEELEVAGGDVVAKVKELVQQGNVRRLIIRKKDGDILFEIPLTAGVVAGSALLVFAPVFAALGALAAFVAEIKLEVVRVVEDEDAANPSTKKKVDVE